MQFDALLINTSTKEYGWRTNPEIREMTLWCVAGWFKEVVSFQDALSESNGTQIISHGDERIRNLSAAISSLSQKVSFLENGFLLNVTPPSRRTVSTATQALLLCSRKSFPFFLSAAQCLVGWCCGLASQIVSPAFTLCGRWLEDLTVFFFVPRAMQGKMI